MEVNKMLLGFIFLILYGCGVQGDESHKLSFDYYKNSCPQVEGIVKTTLQNIFLTDPTSAPALLRLMFHDCQVQGCDASILIDSTEAGSVPTEMDSRKNFGVRKRGLIEMLKWIVEMQCPRQVSCADIIIMAAREAVATSGGPWINVSLGRKDSPLPATYALADASIPSSSIHVDAMLRIFATKGMSIEESVAILGAHTLGVTHCASVVDQLYEPTREFLRLSCPKIQGSLISNTSFVQNDLTNFIFDNQYYVDAIGGRGVLEIDAEIVTDPRTASFVRQFATDQDYFFRAFSSAFVKLSTSGVLLGKEGVIRNKCSSIN